MLGTWTLARGWRALILLLVVVIAFGTAPYAASAQRDPGGRDDDRVAAERTRTDRSGTTTTTTTRTVTTSPRTRTTDGSTPSTAPAPSTGGGAAGCRDAEEWAMLSLINNYRAQHGLGPLVMSPTLTAAAQHHSVDMANRNYFSHTLANGTSWSQNIANFGYPSGSSRAENIAAGYGSAQQTFQQWVNSSGHRANILNPNMRAIGIDRAYNAGSQYGWYWTTTFGSVNDGQVSC